MTLSLLSTEPPFNPYWYPVKRIIRIYDGDTLTLEVTLGFNISYIVQIRLFGVDTPEIRGESRPEGLRVRDHVIELMTKGENVLVNTFKDRTEKYGRFLGIVYIDGLNLNQYLVDNGMAVLYES